MKAAWRRIATAARALDHRIGRVNGSRRVLIEARTPMNLAVLRPVFTPLLGDPRIQLYFTGVCRPDLDLAFEEAGVSAFTISRKQARWTRCDLYINADPWEAVTLRRAARRMNFFHGVAGKYDLDCPAGLPLGLERYDVVAFPNEGRMQNYVAAGLVRASQAALVGYPKADVLLTSGRHPAEAAGALGLDSSRPTVIYAPTFSPASSLNLAGEQIVEALVASGCNVIVKLHDRSLDPDPRYTGGVDWRARLARFAGSGRFLLAASGDSTAYVQASQVMVTDHSSIGFEFCAADRPLIIYHAPALAETARINPEKLALLRSTGEVVYTPDELRRALTAALEAPQRYSAERRRAASQVFYRPGGATARALRIVYELIDLEPAPAALTARPAGAWSGSE
jgi:hypothetical protein